MGFSTREYVDELEKERRKIEVFQRELPLCLDLVIQVIERYRREMTDPTETRRRNEADKGAPLLEQFIPLRPLDADHPKEVEVEDNIDDHHDDRRDDDDDDDGGTSEKKSDWLKTAQLWNENPKDDDSVEVVSEKVGEQQQQQQKSRRCWSPELHRRFVNALEQLGGCHATPKQIREIMKVEGLTNDEVKSHLQKYRLHTKRLHPGAKSISSCETQHPQVVFSIWMQPTGHPNLQAKNMSPAHHTTAKSAGSINRSNPLLQFEHHKQLEQKKSNRSPRGPLRSDQAENSDHSCGTVGSL